MENDERVNGNNGGSVYNKIFSLNSGNRSILNQQLSYYKNAYNQSASCFVSSSGNKLKTSTKEKQPSNEDVKKELIKIVVKCLSWYQYPLQISYKMLLSPSRKDVFNILAFLFQAIDSSMVFQNSTAAEEVPRFYKELGYPISIPKSSLVAPGTSHAWHIHLAAMGWLCELLIYEGECFPHIREGEEIQANYISDSTEGNLESEMGTGNTLRNLILEQFKNSRKDSPTRDQSSSSTLQMHFEEKLSVVRAAVDKKRQDTSNLQNECELISKELQRSEEMERSNKRKKDDIDKISTAQTTAEACCKADEATIAQKLENIKEKNEEIAKMEKLIEDLTDRIQTQGISREEVKEMHQQMQLKRKTQEQALMELETKNSEIWLMMTETGGKIDALKTATRKLQNDLGDLNYDTRTAKLSSEEAWSAVPTFHADSYENANSLDEILRVPWKDTKRQIKQLIEQDKEKDSSVRTMLEEHTQKAKSLQDNITSIKQKISVTNSKIAKLEKEEKKHLDTEKVVEEEIEEQITNLENTTATREKKLIVEVETGKEQVRLMELNIKKTQAANEATVDAYITRLQEEAELFAEVTEAWGSNMTVCSRVIKDAAKIVTDMGNCDN